MTPEEVRALSDEARERFEMVAAKWGPATGVSQEHAKMRLMAFLEDLGGLVEAVRAEARAAQHQEER